MESFLKQYCNKEWQEFVDFHKKQITIKKGEFIFKEGEKTSGLYIVNKGKVKVISDDIEGREVLIRLAADGDIVGHRGFGGNWTYSISAKILEETELTFLPIKIFNILAKSNPEFTYALMMFFAEELRKSEEKTIQLPVKNRVARAVLMNYKTFGCNEKDPQELSYTLSRKEYASKAETTYETVIRVLAELNKENIIKIKGKAISIINLALLQEIAHPKKI